MLQVMSVVADFNGKNNNFKKYIADKEKSITGRSFEQVLADAMRRLK